MEKEGGTYNLMLNTGFLWDQIRRHFKAHRHLLAGSACSLAFQPPFQLCPPVRRTIFMSSLREDPQLSGNLPSLPCPPTCRVGFSSDRSLSLAQIFSADSTAFPHPPRTPSPLSALLNWGQGPWGTCLPPVWCRLLSSVCFFPSVS